ncbi:helix-turn-helix domain-containing protein [Nocardia rhizosphaerihabitans]|uniref:helix-turn-helix domain-containing protein n=1 Tax=Nocardia rhizosphaerihabitans TaxID=1691570 RepID=UPI00366D7B62
MSESRCHSGDEFSDRLNDLIAQWEQFNGVSLTNVGLRNLLAANGLSMSAAYLSQLRSGVRQTPRPHVVEALAGLLGVDPAHLAAGLVEYAIDDEKIIAGLLGEQLRRLMLTSSGLSGRSRERLLNYADSLHAIEESAGDSP